MTIEAPELNAYIWNTEHNCLLSQEHMRIAEVIADYDPNLELAFIPPAKRNATTNEPFAIMHTNPATGYKYVVRTLREDEIDHRILAWLWSNDTQRTDVLARLDAEEAARKALEMHARMERREYAIDFGSAALKKNYFRHNGKLYD